MRKNIAKVIEAFKAGKAAKGDSKGTCRTDGTEVYSYRMCIARRLESGRVAIVPECDAPSMTTKMQIRALMWEFRNQRTCEHTDCHECPELAAACALESKLA